jgi:hypothetical protein
MLPMASVMGPDPKLIHFPRRTTESLATRNRIKPRATIQSNSGWRTSPRPRRIAAPTDTATTTRLTSTLPTMLSSFSIIICAFKDSHLCNLQIGTTLLSVYGASSSRLARAAQRPLLASISKFCNSRFVLLPIEFERAERIVQPSRSRISARPVRLLKVSPLHSDRTNLDSAYEWPTARFATLAAEQLDLVLVPVECRRWLTEEMPRRWANVLIGWQPTVRARDGLRTFTPCERKLHLSSQVRKVAPINQYAKTPAAVTINVRTFQKGDLICRAWLTATQSAAAQRQLRSAVGLPARVSWPLCSPIPDVTHHRRTLVRALRYPVCRRYRNSRKPDPNTIRLLSATRREDTRGRATVNAPAWHPRAPQPHRAWSARRSTQA